MVLAGTSNLAKQFDYPKKNTPQAHYTPERRIHPSSKSKHSSENQHKKVTSKKPHFSLWSKADSDLFIFFHFDELFVDFFAHGLNETVDA